VLTPLRALHCFLFQLKYALPITTINIDLYPGKWLAGSLCTKFAMHGATPRCQLRREAMISAIIHLGNRDWASLIDDFVSLRFLPPDCNRGQIIPVRCSMLTTASLPACT